MPTISILPDTAEPADRRYRAVANGYYSVGPTIGQALDALTAQLPRTEDTTLVVVQLQKPDQFFTLLQQSRLQELMHLWRSLRDRGAAMSDADRAELQALVDAELRAAAQRADTLAKGIGA